MTAVVCLPNVSGIFLVTEIRYAGKSHLMGKGLVFLAVPGYSPSCRGSHSLKRVTELVVLHPHSRRGLGDDSVTESVFCSCKGLDFGFQTTHGPVPVTPAPELFLAPASIGAYLHAHTPTHIHITKTIF